MVLGDARRSLQNSCLVSANSRKYLRRARSRPLAVRVGTWQDYTVAQTVVQLDLHKLVGCSVAPDTVAAVAMAARSAVDCSSEADVAGALDTRHQRKGFEVTGRYLHDHPVAAAQGHLLETVCMLAADPDTPAADRMDIHHFDPRLGTDCTVPAGPAGAVGFETCRRSTDELAMSLRWLPRTRSRLSHRIAH